MLEQRMANGLKFTSDCPALVIYLFSKGNETMASVPNFEFMRISTKITQGFLVLKVPCRKSGVML
jgi:hypothetical protein